jgi:hypothetical protein
MIQCSKSRRGVFSDDISSISVSIPHAVPISGLSGDALHLGIEDGAIDAWKAESRTLIVDHSLQENSKELLPLFSESIGRTPTQIHQASF